VKELLDPCEWARRCRALAKSATDPEVIEQLHVWSVEFAEEAKEATRRAQSPSPQNGTPSRRE
jgi:hypothetical protein